MQQGVLQRFKLLFKPGKEKNVILNQALQNQKQWFARVRVVKHRRAFVQPALQPAVILKKGQAFLGFVKSKGKGRPVCFFWGNVDGAQGAPTEGFDLAVADGAQRMCKLPAMRIAGRVGVKGFGCAPCDRRRLAGWLWLHKWPPWEAERAARRFFLMLARCMGRKGRFPRLAQARNFVKSLKSSQNVP